MTITEIEIEKDLVKLNEDFWSESGDFSAICKVLRASGCDIQRSVIFDVFPDSGETWIVRLMNQDGALLEYDLDIGEPLSSACEDLTETYFAKKQGQIKLGLIRELHDGRRNET